MGVSVDSTWHAGTRVGDIKKHPYYVTVGAETVTQRGKRIFDDHHQFKIEGFYCNSHDYYIVVSG